MTISWQEVTQLPKYADLPDDQKEALRQQYFKEVIAPKAKPEEIAEVAARFDRATDPRLKGKSERSNASKVIERVGTMAAKSAYGLGEAAANAGEKTKAADFIGDVARDTDLEPGKAPGLMDGLALPQALIRNAADYAVGSVVRGGVNLVDAITGTDVRKEARDANAMVRQEADEALSSPDLQYKGNAVQRYGWEVAEGIANMVPALAAGYVARNPGVSLGMIGGQVAGTTYSDYMKETGGDHDRSISAAKFHVMAELIPETIPVTAILRKTKAGEGMKRLFEASFGEGAQEMVTEVLQSTYDNTQLESMGLKEALLNIDWRQVGYAGLLGVGVGGGLAVPGAIGDYRASRQPTEPVPEAAAPTKPKGPLTRAAELSGSPDVAGGAVVDERIEPTIGSPEATGVPAPEGMDDGTGLADVPTIPEDNQIATMPEATGVIEAQIEALQDPATPKDSVFVANGSAMPASIPEGLTVQKGESGTLITSDPQKAQLFEDDESDETVAGILGYQQSKGDIAAAVQAGEGVSTLVVRNDAGIPIHEEAVSDSQLEAAHKRLEADYPGRVEASDPETSLAERAQRLNDEQSSIGPDGLPKPSGKPVTEAPAETDGTAIEQKAASKRPKKEKLNPTERAQQARQIDWENDDLEMVIRKLGGLDVNRSSDFKGRLSHLDETRKLPVGMKKAIERTDGTGMSLDELAEALGQDNTLNLRDELGNIDATKLADLLDQMEDGNPVWLNTTDPKNYDSEGYNREERIERDNIEAQQELDAQNQEYLEYKLAFQEELEALAAEYISAPIDDLVTLQSLVPVALQKNRDKAEAILESQADDTAVIGRLLKLINGEADEQAVAKPSEKAADQQAEAADTAQPGAASSAQGVKAGEQQDVGSAWEAPDTAAEPKSVVRAKPEQRQHDDTAASEPEQPEGWGPVDTAAQSDLPPTHRAKPEQPKTELPGSLDEAAHQAATSPKNDLPLPTEAQIEANDGDGNYKKGHYRWGGLPITIENPAGSKRRPEWPALANHYGDWDGTIGADNDKIDGFFGKKENGKVFIVNQIDQKTGKFDEHKTITGLADTVEQARKVYLANYTKGFKVGRIDDLTVDEFKAWLKDGDTTVEYAAPASQQTQASGITKNRLGAEMGVEVANEGLTDAESIEALAVKAVEISENPRSSLKWRFVYDSALSAYEKQKRALKKKVPPADTSGKKDEQLVPGIVAPGNTVFTEEDANKAREILRKKLGQLNSGIDPEIMQAGITLAGYHIESGARKFSAFSKAMVADLGDYVLPFLRSWYEGARHYPGIDNTGMSTDAEIQSYLDDQTKNSKPISKPVAVRADPNSNLGMWLDTEKTARKLFGDDVVNAAIGDVLEIKGMTEEQYNEELQSLVGREATQDDAIFYAYPMLEGSIYSYFIYGEAMGVVDEKLKANYQNGIIDLERMNEALPPDHQIFDLRNGVMTTALRGAIEGNPVFQEAMAGNFAAQDFAAQKEDPALAEMWQSSIDDPQAHVIVEFEHVIVYGKVGESVSYKFGMGGKTEKTKWGKLIRVMKVDENVDFYPNRLSYWPKDSNEIKQRQVTRNELKHALGKRGARLVAAVTGRLTDQDYLTDPRLEVPGVEGKGVKWADDRWTHFTEEQKKIQLAYTKKASKKQFLKVLGQIETDNQKNFYMEPGDANLIIEKTLMSPAGFSDAVKKGNIEHIAKVAVPSGARTTKAKNTFMLPDSSMQRISPKERLALVQQARKDWDAYLGRDSKADLLSGMPAEPVRLELGEGDTFDRGVQRYQITGFREHKGAHQVAIKRVATSSNDGAEWTPIDNGNTRWMNYGEFMRVYHHDLKPDDKAGDDFGLTDEVSTAQQVANAAAAKDEKRNKKSQPEPDAAQSGGELFGAGSLEGDMFADQAGDVDAQIKPGGKKGMALSNIIIKQGEPGEMKAVNAGVAFNLAKSRLDDLVQLKACVRG